MTMKDNVVNAFYTMTLTTDVGLYTNIISVTFDLSLTIGTLFSVSYKRPFSSSLLAMVYHMVVKIAILILGSYDPRYEK